MIADWARTPYGQLLFVDELNSRVLIEEPSGNLRRAPGGFRYPRAVAVLGDTAYVVDSWNHRVKAFTLPEWKFAFEFGSFFCPSSIVAINNFLIIADTNNRRLSFHTPDGACAFTYELNRFPKRVQIGERGAIVVRYDDGETETLNY